MPTDASRSASVSALASSSIGPNPGRPALAVLDDVRITGRLIQDFVPLAESLDWRLGQLAWHRDGDSGFLRSEIPYLINNSGRLSRRAAVLLLSALRAAPPLERIDLLEIGAGTGLFASLLLRHFFDLCEQKGVDFHRRIRLYVTDASARTVESWSQRSQFAALAPSVETRVLDADGLDAAPEGIFAAFANYVLDVLPAQIVRDGDGGPEQLCLRVHDSAAAPSPTGKTLARTPSLALSPTRRHWKRHSGRARLMCPTCKPLLPNPKRAPRSWSTGAH